MNKTFVRAAAIAFACASLASACSSPVDLDHADFEGIISSQAVVSAGSVDLSIDATGNGSSETRRLLVNSAAKIFVRATTGESRSGSLEDLVQGARVRVRTSGVEERSLPPTYLASWVEVLQ